MKLIQKRKLAFALRMWMVPTLLVVVACIHMHQWCAQNRSSWGAGAGFGMFATVDYHGSRFFRCTAWTDRGTVRLEIPKSIGANIGKRARAIPSEYNLKLLSDALAEQEWFLSDKSDEMRLATISSIDTDAGQRLTVYKIEVEIRGLEIDPSNKQFASFLIKRDAFAYLSNPRVADVDVH